MVCKPQHGCINHHKLFNQLDNIANNHYEPEYVNNMDYLLDYISINNSIKFNYYYVYNNVGNKSYYNNKLVNHNNLDYITDNKQVDYDKLDEQLYCSKKHINEHHNYVDDFVDYFVDNKCTHV